MKRSEFEIKGRIKILEEMKNDPKYADSPNVQALIDGELRGLYWTLMYEVDK